MNCVVRSNNDARATKRKSQNEMADVVFFPLAFQLLVITSSIAMEWQIFLALRVDNRF